MNNQEKLEMLYSIDFGERVAEDDSNLADYFVETNIWRQLTGGNIDVVYGAKGSGKSALYRQLMYKEQDFKAKKIFLIPAERIRGATVFKTVLGNEELNEVSFKHLWFLYILTLIGDKIKDSRHEHDEVNLFIKRLEDEGLLEGGGLRQILLNVREYVTNFFKKVESVETEFSVDPITSSTKVKGKISISEPSSELRKAGAISIYQLIEEAEEALEKLDIDMWITFDRLDIAFSDNSDLETLAIKTLFQVYNDLKSSQKIKMKIFIRDDIWKRVTEEGFREASHITKQVTVEWNERDLLYLVISRAVENEGLVEKLNADKKVILSSVRSQEEFFYEIFPDQVDTGRNPNTFNWMLSRVQDGKKIVAPRELIHLLNEAKDKQIKAIETGVQEDSINRLIGRKALKEALYNVSKVRLEQTIYSEYPGLKRIIESLEEQKTEQDLETLSKIFSKNENETRRIANELVNIGIFEDRRGTYWTPFLYRTGLRMSQGRED